VAQQLRAFWGELSPCEHFVQIYDADDVFMTALADFITSGLVAGYACVVIGTPRHRQELDHRLQLAGIDVDVAKSQDRLISLDAAEIIEKFMINNWPDEELFKNVVTEILERARRRSDKVRVVGEMVAVLWANGHCGATVRLEHMWSAMCRQDLFTLFCAYPKSGFTESPVNSISWICAEHSKVLAS
jgi:hypothetical protein